MGVEAEYEQWKEDASLLPAIGQLFASQPTELELRLPRNVADEVVAIWQRDGSEGQVGRESLDQKKVRGQAASVSLIGLSIESTGRAEGDEVVFKVDAWFVGDALAAADEAGLLHP